MKSISITSGKGGVGKTNVAISLAHALCQMGQRVLLLDADLGLANVDILLGLHVDQTLFHVIRDRIALRKVVVHVAKGFDLIPAHSGVVQLERLSGDERARLAAELETLSDDYDVLLIDTGAGIGDNVLFFNDFADYVLLVTVPEPTALTDTYAMLKILTRTYGVSAMGLVVNQAATSMVATTVHDKLEQVSQRFLDVHIPLAGHLPNDASVAAAVQNRTPAVLHAPNALFSRCVRTLASKILTDVVLNRPHPERVWRSSHAPHRRPMSEAAPSHLSLSDRTTPSADDSSGGAA